MGCSAVNTDLRYIPVGSYQGRLVTTSLGDDQLKKIGIRVLRRWKSLPQVAQVEGFDRSFPGQLLEEDNEILEMIEKLVKNDKKTSPSIKTLGEKGAGKGSGKDQLPAGTEDSESFAWDPFSDAGFDLVHKQEQEHQDHQESKQNEGEFAPVPVKVAVIDSGVVPATAPISSNLVAQWNFTSQLEMLRWRDHGTAIASLFAGLDKNGLPDRSYAFNARIISIKIGFAGDAGGDADPDDTALQLSSALDQAMESGAKIVNMSFAYTGNVPSEVQTLERALMAQGAAKGVVFVAAAGNEGVSLDQSPVFPARYDLQNLIVVGNHSFDHRRSQFSNYGRSVGLSALGESVPLSTVYGQVEFFTGTSFSAPMVGAALALGMGVAPELNWHEHIEALKETAAPSADDSVSYGRLQVPQYLDLISRKSRHSRGQSRQLPLREEPLWAQGQ